MEKQKEERLGETSVVKSPTKIRNKNVGTIEENTIRVNNKQLNFQAETGQGTIEENTVVGLKLNEQQKSVVKERSKN